MQRYQSLEVPETARGTSVAMGNFDGLHLGHQSVLDLARRADMPLGVVTFEPHPREVFAPDAPPFRLMNATSRAHRLEKLGVQHLFEIPFNRDLANLTPEAFVNEVLVKQLGIRHLVVGADFKFGKSRKGNTNTLSEAPFELSVAPLLQGPNGAISSTAIRTALSEGRPTDAADMLGHWHRIEGIVEHGFKRGREMGFPTANISMAGLHLPAFGIYACTVDVRDGPHMGTYRAVASLGSRPTFGDNAPNLEVMLLDFSGDLYGAELSVALMHFQRPELKFDGMDPLIVQMHADVVETRKLLA